LRATELEFRFRFFIILAFLVGGFWCGTSDSVNVAAASAQSWVGHPVQLCVPSDRHVVQAVLALGAALAVLAALLRTWAAAYLRSEIVQDWRIHSERLVADGPFRYVRNPLYLGALLFAVGFGLTASRLGFVVIVGGLTLFYCRLIAREESLLRASRGEPYHQFLMRVPRLVPSLSPRVAAGGIRPRWAQAVAGESFMWFFAVAVTCFAATLNQTLLLTITASGVAASLLAKAVLRQKRQR